MSKTYPISPTGRFRISIVLALSLLLYFEASAADSAPPPQDDQFSVMLLTSGGEQGPQLAVRWTGDPSARLSAWLDDKQLLDTERFGFDTTDANSDGLPDAVRLPGFVPARVDATWDAEDTDGELDLVLTQPGLAPTTAFPDLVIMEVEVQSRVGATGQVPQPFRLSTGPSTSLGDVYGRSLELQISTPEFGFFMDGFESGDTRAWTSHQ